MDRTIVLPLVVRTSGAARKFRDINPHMSSSALLRFEFATAARVVFGGGTLRELGTIAQPLGRRALVVTGRNSDRAQPALAQLAGAGLGTVVFAVPGEPTTDLVRAGTANATPKELPVQPAYSCRFRRAVCNQPGLF